MQTELTALATFLSAQRWCVLEVVDGLDEVSMRHATVPSGWTPVGMIEHLAGAERQWFQRVIAGIPRAEDQPVIVGESEGDAAFVTARSVADALALYREQVARSDEILAGAQLDAFPAGEVPPDMVDEIRTVRDVVLHMIEETARHAGHLDIARELLDGRTGLGPR